MDSNKEAVKLTTIEIATIGIMIAVIEVCKIALQWLPNIELTSFWLIMFTLYFDKRVYYVVPAFILIEGAIWGFGIWWIMYLYAWPMLILVTTAFKRSKSTVTYALISGLFGLGFGFLCSFPYIFINDVGQGLANGIRAAFAWWVAGIPFDILHGIGNFVIMLVLYKPMSKAMVKIRQRLKLK